MRPPSSDPSWPAPNGHALSREGATPATAAVTSIAPACRALGTLGGFLAILRLDSARR